MKSKNLTTTMSSEGENDLERANLLCDHFQKFGLEKRKAFIKVARTLKSVDDTAQIATALNLYNQFHKIYGRSEYLCRQVALMFQRHKTALAVREEI